MDLLVKLYDVEPDADLDRRLKESGVVIRRALAPELDTIRAFIATRFSAGWVSEAQVAFSRDPNACLIAVRDGKLLGFACYDAVALGFFGPTGVDEAARGLGIGKALLIRTLLAMRERGYGYAAIGWAGPVEFYARAVGAMPIPGSEKSVYAGLLDPLVHVPTG
ncbi:GNAT family N-acetyltransferase [Pleomorphomonas carboxyditropha]|uniref:GNAT family N-acetyltransferase n=1 Tax=Pleomorphomonas carboxyditropha TaxID=2023338 RepID=A0A2G9WTZ3_9HYPH|nr:GNAT family N-acetyltransferase [Pleomorphomonas carboxyditropha]PIO98178.1 GNAT family N-acetyltransferase [Pleomorphomonas carboxyditropha]